MHGRLTNRERGNRLGSVGSAAEVEAGKVEVLDLAVVVVGVDGGRALEELRVDAVRSGVGAALGDHTSGDGATDTSLEGDKALVVEVLVLASALDGNGRDRREVVELFDCKCLSVKTEDQEVEHTSASLSSPPLAQGGGPEGPPMGAAGGAAAGGGPAG